MLAFSNLLQESDECFKNVFSKWFEDLRYNVLPEQMLRAIVNPMIVRLRMLQFEGVMQLFDEFGEREVDSGSNQIMELKSKLFTIYQFAKSQHKLARESPQPVGQF